MIRTLRTLIAVFVLFGATPYAQALEATVEPEAYGDEAFAAQEKALRIGEKMALYQVLYPRIPKDAEAMVLNLSDQARQNLITNFNILNEIKRGKYYKAQITYTFDDKLIDRLLENYKTQATGDTNSQAIMILPVFDDGMVLRIWDEVNPWRDAMHAAALQTGEGRVVVPNGDPEDLKLVDEQVVLSGNNKTLGQLASRYGARSIIVAQTRTVKRDGRTGYRVILRRAGGSKEDEQVRDFFPLDGAETTEQVLLRAAKETAAYARDSSKNYGSFLDVGPGAHRAKVIRAEYRNNREWVDIKNIISQTPGVEKVDMDAISSDYAVLTLYYNGAESVIQKLLMSRGVKLEETGKYWTVSMR
ncbi:MAG: DUF2066 domain-containing protein [Rickettsiales bacterium]